MRKIVGTVVVCLLALGSMVIPTANTAPDVPTQTAEGSALLVLGPVKAIAHIYIPSIEATALDCQFGGVTAATIPIGDVTAVPGDQFASVVITLVQPGVNFSTWDATEITVVAANDCAVAASGSVLVTVTGTLTPSGDTFSFNITAP